MNSNTERCCGLEDRYVRMAIEKAGFAALTEKAVNELHRTMHSCVVNALISHYMEHYCPEYDKSDFAVYFEGFLDSADMIPDGLDCAEIPTICEELHIHYLNSWYTIENGVAVCRKSKNNLIKNGAVYTQDQVAYAIVERTLRKVKADDMSTVKVLDFAAGTGRFYRQIVKCLWEKWQVRADVSMLNSIYAVDIDPVAVNICRLSAVSLLETKTLDAVRTLSRHIICKNALVRGNLFAYGGITDKDCDGFFVKGFDAVVSNPPYLVLKPNKKKMDEEMVEGINRMARYFRSSGDFRYSMEGMLNLYQLALEAMIGMLKAGGEMGVICPSTLFADVSVAKLRKYILSNHCVSYIRYFPENSPLFDNVAQATCIFHLTKNGTTSDIDIMQDEKTYAISIDDVKELFPVNWEIPSIGKTEWRILKKIGRVARLKEYDYIRNRRGELDLTLHRDYITSSPTALRLVRGNMLSGSSIGGGKGEYVKKAFLDMKSADYMRNDYGRRRLVCPQISNQSQRIRLKFLLSERSDVLANSCNYVTVPEEWIEKVQALLNSALLNWRFKITSTNNHINNYEIAELPIIDMEKIDSSLIRKSAVDADKTICELYGLDEEESNYIISQYYEII